MAHVNEFFYYESKFDIKKKHFFSGTGGPKNPNLKQKKKNSGEGVLSGVRGWGVGEGRSMDRRTSPNQFSPSTSSKLGA